MRTKLYMIALAAMTMILALSSCSESEDLLSAFHSDPNAVRITAQVGKASPMAAPAAFRWEMPKRRRSLKMVI